MKDGTASELYRMMILDALEVKIVTESDDTESIVRKEFQWDVVSYQNQEIQLKIDL